MEKILGLYGAPPIDLVSPEPAARQFSPLHPGAAALEEQTEGSLAGFTMLTPPGTIERRYSLALALRALAPDALITALAPKDKGGSRIKKELEAFGCEVEEDSKRHHRIARARRPADLAALAPALGEGAPLFLEELGLWTQPGVFSWDRLDPGSSLLLEHLPEFSGRGADLGAGLGCLSRAVLGSAKVKHISLVEIDRRAVACARRNVNPARSTVIWADLRHAELHLDELDFVVSNPPFHDAGQEDHGLGQEFLRKTAGMLKTGGTAWIVANRHLPYEAVMAPLFSRVRLVTETKAFKIVEAQK